MEEILEVKVYVRSGKLRLRYGVNREAFRHLKRRVLGKRVLFTDNHGWSDEEIVEGYRGQHHVERAFRDMKDPAIVQFSPMFHWTDSKIRVQAFCCVLALVLTGLVHRQVVQAGIDISRARLLGELKDIRQITNLYPPSGSQDRRGPGRPRAETIMSKTSDLQKRLGDALGISQFLDR